MLTVVMYHYVRDLEHSRYPRIKGRTVTDFRGQLDYLARHYTVVGIPECLAALAGEAALPTNAALLTFDDGFRDHYNAVFPLLHERGIQGCFYPPAAPIAEAYVLDVHKIHFILASAEIDVVLTELLDRLEPWREAYSIADRNALLAASRQAASRFDPPEVVFVKRMLQRDLPPEVRHAITAELFRKFVTVDERAFSAELYMSEDELRTMTGAGMHVGAHGWSHAWMDTLSPGEQAADVDRALAFLQRVGGDSTGWTMAYPYGAHDASLIEVIRARGCRMAFTSQVAPAQLDPKNALQLPRLDTNDLPCDAAAPGPGASTTTA